jgi:hypothetical protein
MSLRAVELYAVHSMRNQKILTCELAAVIYKLNSIAMDCDQCDGKLQK